MKAKSFINVSVVVCALVGLLATSHAAMADEGRPAYRYTVDASGPGIYTMFWCPPQPTMRVGFETQVGELPRHWTWIEYPRIWSASNGWYYGSLRSSYYPIHGHVQVSIPYEYTEKVAVFYFKWTGWGAVPITDPSKVADYAFVAYMVERHNPDGTKSFVGSSYNTLKYTGTEYVK